MFSRREVLRALSALPLAIPSRAAELTYRPLGRTGRWVAPFGLGGQASLQYTPPGVDPEDLPVRAVELGVNYLDTANAYGPSQWYYAAAFRKLRLTPGAPDYNAALRERLFVATKTYQRTGRGALEELRASLTILFGDGRGGIPEGAYVDSMQIHNLVSLDEVNQIYAPNGALAALLDYRDGTNRTGLNPQSRRYLRHIGITGHEDSTVLMNALQRDEAGIIDTLLVALNANDRRYLPHQNNVLPLAVARGLGVIAMKVFANGVFLGKPTPPPDGPAGVVLTVGAPYGPAPADLLRYTLSLPGVSCAITGIGRIDRANPQADQIVANLESSQASIASPAEMRRLEQAVADHHGPRTNYFQNGSRGLVQPAEVRWRRDGDRAILTWTTAIAGAAPLQSYRIYAGDRPILALPFRPQTTTAPLSVAVPLSAITAEPVRVVASEEPPPAVPSRPSRSRSRA